MADDLPALFLIEEDGEKRLKAFASRAVFAETNLERDIEALVKNSMLSNVTVLDELVLFAQQPSYEASQARRPDLIALDGERNVVIIEFKRDRAPEDIVFQTLNYAAWFAEQTYEVLNAFATKFFATLPESERPSSLKEAFYKRFPASTSEDGSDDEEDVLPTDAEFLTGFNAHPRIILVATEIGDEIQRIMRFLSTRGLKMEGHEFQYFRSPKGDELIHRQTVGMVEGPTPRPTAVSARTTYRTLDELADHVEDETVRQWIAAVQALSDEFSFHPSVRFAIPGGGDWSLRFGGRNRAQGYFAKRWLFVWWLDRFDGDVDWFKERLSAPGEVKVDAKGTLRFHVRTSNDFDVLKNALQASYDRSIRLSPRDDADTQTGVVSEPHNTDAPGQQVEVVARATEKTSTTRR